MVKCYGALHGGRLSHVLHNSNNPNRSKFQVISRSGKILKPGILVFRKLKNDIHKARCRSQHALHKLLHPPLIV